MIFKRAEGGTSLDDGIYKSTVFQFQLLGFRLSFVNGFLCLKRHPPQPLDGHMTAFLTPSQIAYSPYVLVSSFPNGTFELHVNVPLPVHRMG